MAKGVYVGVSSKARKVRKIYVGVGGKARRVKKAYIGVNGKARKVFGGEPVYLKATTLQTARMHLAAASVGSYVLFGGGGNSSGLSSTVDAFNTSATRTSATALSQARQQLAAVSIGNYALFGGGSNQAQSRTTYGTVDAYNASLTRSSPSNLRSGAYTLGSATVGSYALFAGGDSGSRDLDYVTAYNTSLSRSYATNLSESRHWISGGASENHALFAGGNFFASTNYSDAVDAYDTSLTHSLPAALEIARQEIGGARNGKYAMFAGGYASGLGSLDKVDVYSASLVRLSCSSLQVGRTPKGVTFGDYVVFAGGGGRKHVDSYDISSLAHYIETPLSVGRGHMGAAVVGDLAFFGGGSTSNDLSASVNTVDIYET